MSAHMAAAGNLQWEDRYRSFDPKVAAAIQEALSLAPETVAREYLAQTDTANVKLIAVKNQVFDLVRQGRREAPMSLISDETYENSFRGHPERGGGPRPHGSDRLGGRRVCFRSKRDSSLLSVAQNDP